MVINSRNYNFVSTDKPMLCGKQFDNLFLRKCSKTVIQYYLLMEEVDMRTITTVILALMLITFVGCGNQDKSPQQSAESQTTVSVPKVDLHSAVYTENLG